MVNVETLCDQLASCIENNDEQGAYLVVQTVRGRSRQELQELLHAAIRRDDTAIVQLLLRQKIDVTHEDVDGQRAIHVAAQWGNPLIIKAIINAGSPVNIVDKHGGGALHMCLEDNREESALMLIREGATVNRPRRYDTGEAPIHVAAKVGLNEVLKTMILKGADVNLQSADQSTPLHLAVKEKHAWTAKLLCEAGSRVNICNRQGRTPFHLAAQQISVEMVRILLPHVHDVNHPGRDGLTALHFVACAFPPSHSQSEILDMLVSNGANVRQTDSEGRTALHMAAYAGNVSTVEVLIANGAALDVTENVIGETPLNTAATADRHDVMKALLESGANVNLGDKNNQTPLHKLQGVRATASKYRSTELLLQYGARVNALNAHGVTPFEQCIFRAILNRECRDGLSILRRLVSAGAHLRPCTTQRSLQHSPLCWLTWHGELEAAAFLVNAGWSLNEEKWLNLPGKNAAMEQFISRLRLIVQEPQSLSCVCRRVIREHAIAANDDRDLVPIIDRLPIPTTIKKFLTFENEDNML